MSSGLVIFSLFWCHLDILSACRRIHKPRSELWFRSTCICSPNPYLWESGGASTEVKTVLETLRLWLPTINRRMHQINSWRSRVVELSTSYVAEIEAAKAAAPESSRANSCSHPRFIITSLSLQSLSSSLIASSPIVLSSPPVLSSPLSPILFLSLSRRVPCSGVRRCVLTKHPEMIIFPPDLINIPSSKQHQSHDASSLHVSSWRLDASILLSIHPSTRASMLYHLSEVGSQGQQPQQGGPDVPLLGYFVQPLRLGTWGVCLSSMSWVFPGASYWWDEPRTPHQEHFIITFCVTNNQELLEHNSATFTLKQDPWILEFWLLL